MIPIAKPLIGEEEKKNVLEVLDSGALAQGPKVKALEDVFARYCGVEYAVATSSGTTALQVALLAHGIGPGDEVITTPFTFIASANSILSTGARPVFVDIDPATYNLNPDLLKAAITPRTKAIMPVHLFGLPADMAPILALVEKHSLVVIEDACQAHGAEYHGSRVGSFGTGCFSFYPTKNMTAGEGGMITTDDEDVADRCRVIRRHGMRQRYHHDEVGYNFRMTDIHAAIGLAQMEKLERFNETRISNARFLSENLIGVTTPIVPAECRHVFHQYTVRVPDGRRDLMREELTERGIGTGVYYPVPVHKQRVYLDQGYNGAFPEAEQAADAVLSLPVHPGLSEYDLHAIIAALNELSV